MTNVNEKPSVEALRSLLFVPGNRLEMLQKALTLNADALVPDLEDSVPVAEKLRAREIVKNILPSLAQSGHILIPRINSISTGLSRGDLTAIVGPHIYGVSVGKVESTWEIRELSRIIAELEEQTGVPVGRTRIFPWLESALGITRAFDICTASERIFGASFGAEDYTADTGIQRTESGQEMVFPRQMVAMAANAAGVLALDTPYVNFRDAEGLERDIQSGLPLGYKGKFAIHPSQLEPINRLFSPDAETIEYARRVMQAFEEAEARGHGSTSLDGKMIDIPIVKRAQKLLAFAKSISQKEEMQRQ